MPSERRATLTWKLYYYSIVLPLRTQNIQLNMKICAVIPKLQKSTLQTTYTQNDQTLGKLDLLPSSKKCHVSLSPHF